MKHSRACPTYLVFAVVIISTFAVSALLEHTFTYSEKNNIRKYKNRHSNSTPNSPPTPRTTPPQRLSSHHHTHRYSQSTPAVVADRSVVDNTCSAAAVLAENLADSLVDSKNLVVADMAAGEIRKVRSFDGWG